MCEKRQEWYRSYKKKEQMKKIIHKAEFVSVLHYYLKKNSLESKKNQLSFFLNIDLSYYYEWDDLFLVVSLLHYNHKVEYNNLWNAVAAS